MTAELAEAAEFDADQTGALIEQVVPNSPAAKAGLKAGTEDFDLNGETVKVGGDVVVMANGKNVETMQDLVKIVQGMKSGDKLSLTVLRDGKETKVTVTLATRPTAGAARKARSTPTGTAAGDAATAVNRGTAPQGQPQQGQPQATPPESGQSGCRAAGFLRRRPRRRVAGCGRYRHDDRSGRGDGVGRGSNRRVGPAGRAQ